MKEHMRVPIESVEDIVRARSHGRELAAQLGFPSVEVSFIATAISELARNILSHAETGEIVLGVLEQSHRMAMLIEARDQGPGIANVAQAMRDGFSTSGGLGLGLPGTRRLMDEFDIASSVGTGTTVRVAKWLPPRTPDSSRPAPASSPPSPRTPPEPTPPSAA